LRRSVRQGGDMRFVVRGLFCAAIEEAAAAAAAEEEEEEEVN
jgi:hypothetical protein